MRVQCAAVRLSLPAMDRVVWQESRLGRHATSCLRCQAETARYRKLHRSLEELGHVTEPAPPTILPRVHHAIGGPQLEERRSRGPLAGSVAGVAATAGAVVAAAAGTAAVVAWRRTHGAT
ncbi:MAG: hypothetical protein PVI35_07930 [Acidimicrobiia bacterium]|jgi:hypothetical protein